MAYIIKHSIIWRICCRIYYLPLFISKHLLFFVPLKQKITFCNFNGRGMGENPGYIAQEILNQKLQYDIVWLVSDMNVKMPNGIRKVKFDSLRAAYELSSSKIIINNVKNSLPFIKKKEQYYIQTWHAELPLKYVEGECEDKLDPQYIKESKYNSSITNLILSGCSLDTFLFKNYFWYSGEIMEKGLPRNDKLFNVSKAEIKKIREKLNIKNNNKVLLYAPTFRDNYDMSKYDLNVEAVISLLNSIKNEEWVAIIRMHPNIKDKVEIKDNEKLRNGSKIADPQNLVLISDMLITDYSSIMVDFMLQRKPVLLYTPDLEDYEKLRGLRPIYKDLPFIKARSNKELLYKLDNLDLLQYYKKIDDFVNKRIHSFDDGHASEHVVDRIKYVMNQD